MRTDKGFKVNDGEARFGEHFKMKGVTSNTLDIKISGTDTENDLAVFEQTGLTPNGGPPLHIHPFQDEWFYVIEGEQGGISKSVNWQGGGSFVYLELKKYNQTFIEQIEEAKDSAALLQIWEQMKAKSFLDYNVDIKKQDEHLEDFKTLSLAEQKQHLCELLDKNQLYVNLSSLNDADFTCTEEEKKIAKDFFQIKN